MRSLQGILPQKADKHPAAFDNYPVPPHSPLSLSSAITNASDDVESGELLVDIFNTPITPCIELNLCPNCRHSYHFGSG